VLSQVSEAGSGAVCFSTAFKPAVDLSHGNESNRSSIRKRILDEMKGKPSQLIADRIVRDLGKRIRQRARDREDFSQAAARIVREATERE